MTGHSILVQVLNFDQTVHGLYWSFTLLLKPPVLICSCVMMTALWGWTDYWCRNFLGQHSTMLHVVNERNFVWKCIKLHTTIACAYMLYVKRWSLTEVRPWLPWWCLQFPCNALHPLTSLGWSQFSCASSRWTNPQWWFHWWVSAIPAGRHTQRKKGREGRREGRGEREAKRNEVMCFNVNLSVTSSSSNWMSTSFILV